MMGNLLSGGAVLLLEVPGGRYWAAERGDPYGSRSSAAVGLFPRRVLWKVRSNQPFPGGPAVAAERRTIPPYASNKLLALNPDGATLWETPRPAPDTQVGSPALAPDGTVYVTSAAGGRTAIAPAGDMLWSYPADAAATTYRQLRHGPVVSSEGVVYFLLEDTPAVTACLPSRPRESCCGR